MSPFDVVRILENTKVQKSEYGFLLNIRHWSNMNSLQIFFHILFFSDGEAGLLRHEEDHGRTDGYQL